jgi:ABC-type transporter Mla MlaB component
MMICMTGNEARLEGDWTLSGVTRNIDTLALSLQQLKSGDQKKLQVDCRLMEEVDIGGLQFLNVWMKCARNRGLEPKLINVPSRFRHAMHVLTGHHCEDAPPPAQSQSLVNYLNLSINSESVADTVNSEHCP